jgi:adenylosuccinate synthase
MSQKRQAIILADLGFGDAGKGTLADYLSRQLAVHTIVRYNGGPQAAHNVVTPDGRHHTFAQFGSGMFLPHTKTLLSRFMLVNPLNMLKEERHLSSIGVTDALTRTMIDRRALIITPFQRAINRLREVARAADRHGSCGEGIGECMSDALTYGDDVLRVGDLQGRATMIKKLRLLRDAKYYEFTELSRQLPDTEPVRQERAIFTDKNCGTDCADVYAYLADQVSIVNEADIQAIGMQSGTMLFEGAQGVLLDENYGFAPYTTWSTTTFANAETLLRECSYAGEVIKLGIIRAYATRHGAGPFPTEDSALTAALPDQHNGWNDWQRAFRVGYFDLLTTRYALEVAGRPDYLAITNIDRLKTVPAWKTCTAYAYQGEQPDLSDYFEHDQSNISKIKVCQPADLIHQEKLTQRLLSCTPEYLNFAPLSGEKHTNEEMAAYLSLLEEMLSVPIAISSYGLTAREKQWGSVTPSAAMS